MTPKLNKVSYLFFAVVALIIGSVLQYYHINLTNYWIETSLFILVLIIFLGLKRLAVLKLPFFLSVFLLVVLLGNRNAYNAESINQEEYFSNIDSDNQPIYTLKITSPSSEKQNSVGIEAEVIQVNETQSVGTVQLYLEKSEAAINLSPGDIIESKSYFNEIEANSNPNTFDFKNYSRIQGIYHQSYISSNEWELKKESPSSFYSFSSGIRSYFENKLDRSGISKSELGVIKALILGDKVDLEDSTRNNYAAAGAMHILAVSGLHVGIVLLILTIIFKPLKRLENGKLYFSLLIIFSIWLYAFITGASSSVLRSAFMFSIISIGMNLERDQSTIHAVIVSAFVLILINPFIVFDVGFQLSYAAVLGIIFLQPKIASYWLIKNKFLNYFWQIMAVSMAAQIATAPISLYYFHQFPSYFLLTNLVVIPAAFIILLFGILFLSLSWVPILGDALVYSLRYSTLVLNEFISIIAHIPGAVIDGLYLLKLEVLMLYACICAFLAFWIYRIRYSLISTAVLVTSFLSFNMFAELTIEGSSELVFYKLKEGNAISLNKENSHILIYDNISHSDFKYNMKPHWNFRFGMNTPSNTYDLEKVKNLSFEGITISIYSKNNINPNSNYCFFQNDVFLDEQSLDKINNSSTQLVLGSNCSYNFWRFLDKKFEERVHFIKKDGALIRHL